MKDRKADVICQIDGLIETAFPPAEVWSGTGTSQSASSSSTEPRLRMRPARGRARERRPSYLKAWMMARRAPSYGPIARARSIAPRDVWHRAQMQGDSGRFQVPSGSPQQSHTGGVTGKTALQQDWHTGPLSGCSRSV
jgi:hypothetical protein